MINEIGGCLIRIQEMSDSLSPKEQKVAQCIVSNPRKVVNMSIDDLATKCDVSTSTVVRLCKTLHYSGFKELCRHLCCDLSSGADMNEQFEDIHPGDDPETIMRNICLGSIRAIENTMSVMTTDALHQAVDALCLAKRIDFYGIGTSGLVALDAGTKFTRINKFVIAHADPTIKCFLQHAEEARCRCSNLLFHETNDILNVAHEIRKQGTIIITLTQYSKNSLAALADINLYCVSTETLLRSGAMSSRIAQLTIIDILFASVCSRNFDEVKPHLERSRIITRRAHVQPGE